MKVIGKLFLVSAPSGAGKTAIVSAVIARLGSLFSLKRVITYTSREPRIGERDGHDYYFISSQEFEKKIQEGFFLEWSGAYGNYYGSPYALKQELIQGASLIMIIDRVGLQTLAQIMPEALRIYITVPDIATLKTRLLMRGTDPIEKIEKRILLAVQEIEDEKRSSLCHFTLMNDNFEQALIKIETFLRIHIENHYIDEKCDKIELL